MTVFLPEDTALLRLAVDRIIPADGSPGATALDTVAYVQQRLADSRAAASRLRSGLRLLDGSAHERFGVGFAALPADQQDALLVDCEGAEWFTTLAEWSTEGFYADPGNGGNKDAGSWRSIGYDPRLPESHRAPPAQGRAGPAGEGLFDVIIAGAGAGGGVAACVLAEAGKRVLLMERGPSDSTARALIRDHLRNQRLSTLGHNAGPDIIGNPRVLVDPEGRERIVQPHEVGYHNNAAAVGSGTLVYGAQAWRFHPDDFRMAARYGVPAGSSLADWPFGYGELEPYYERAEWEIGVAGQSAGHPGPRRRGFPMPPVPGYASRRILSRGAAVLGLSTVIPPLLINTIPRHGRQACPECGSCVGFACPADAKNGTQNTVIARALATGRCTLVTSAMVVKIDTGPRRTVAGVTYIDTTHAGAAAHSVRSRAVLLCAGAVETARLLLLSASDAEPKGLGNCNDIVGRNLQGHFSTMVYGQFAEPIYDPRGPGVTLATCDHNHGNPGIIGGSMLADDFIMLPVIFWKRAMPPGVPRWGAAAKDAMRANYRHVGRIFGPVQEITSAESRVTLDPAVRDKWGLPVARLSGAIHPETLRTAEFMRGKSHDWLRASGAVRTWSEAPFPRLSAGQHQAGTCRMGTDPETSVTDPMGRVWGYDNLFIADSSLHPTNGGFNPVLTILALAFRNADFIARNL